MLAKLKELFASSTEHTTTQSKDHYKHLAAAALLIDVARADYADDPRELIAVRSALQQRFGLSHEELDTLVDLAHNEAANATSSYQFTRIINDECSDTDKFDLIRLMWQVAYADGELDRYEEHLIRKIAELLYVPHSEFIRAKHRVQQQVQQQQ